MVLNARCLAKPDAAPTLYAELSNNNIDTVIPRIDGFHCDVIKWKSQNSEILRILIYTRLKINKKRIFVQVFIPVACFISKIQQFELPSFHSA